MPGFFSSVKLGWGHGLVPSREQMNWKKLGEPAPQVVSVLPWHVAGPQSAPRSDMRVPVLSQAFPRTPSPSACLPRPQRPISCAALSWDLGLRLCKHGASAEVGGDFLCGERRRRVHAPSRDLSSALPPTPPNPGVSLPRSGLRGAHLSRR